MIIPIGVLNKALESAKKSNFYIYKVGAVIFKGKKIISCGYNDIRSFSKINNKYKKHFTSCHAEQFALMNIPNKKNIKNASIFIIRLNISGKTSLAKPCEYCLKTIKSFNIKKIYYSNKKKKIILEKLLNDK